MKFHPHFQFNLGLSQGQEDPTLDPLDLKLCITSLMTFEASGQTPRLPACNWFPRRELQGITRSVNIFQSHSKRDNDEIMPSMGKLPSLGTDTSC